MNRKQIQSALTNLTEQKAPSANINLWPAIQSRIQMSHSKQSKGIIMDKEPNSQKRKLKPAFALLVIVLIGGLFFLLPQGRTLAQEIMHFFTRGETNVMPGPTSTPVKWVEQTPGVALPTATPFVPQATATRSSIEGECEPVNLEAAHCSIDQIRDSVDFQVYAFAELPEGMYFTGATGGSDWVDLSYQSPLTYTDAGWVYGYLTLQERPFTNDPDQIAWEVGADAVIQSVQVGEVTGEYTVGHYDGTNGPPVWVSTDDQWIRWVDKGILFTLDMMGTLPDLSRDELAALAATLTGGPVGTNGIPVVETEVPSSEPVDFYDIYPLTLAEANEKAGFTMMTPDLLPETLSFVGANYDEETDVVNLFYYYNYPDMPEATDGLVISEQVLPDDGNCSLCGFIQGEYGPNIPSKLVGNNAIIEPIQIGELMGQYVEGIGWMTATDENGWYWSNEPYRKRVRFQTDELAVEVWAESYTLTREDVITIAESLK